MSTNPLKETRNRLGLTMDELAAIAGVGKQTIVRTEQGLYRNISPKILRALRNRGVDTNYLDKDYQKWRIRKRQEAGDKALLVEYNSGKKEQDGYNVHPFEAWLFYSELTSIRFCVEFCVHRAHVHKFLRQPYLCQTVPEEILTALHTAGYRTDYLVNDFEKFKEHLRLKAVS